MERKEVSSSQIKSVGYLESTSTLEVEFSNGALWQYGPVLPETFKEMEEAESIGSYFRKNIIGQYVEKKVT